jgi:hypothetical protein
VSGVLVSAAAGVSRALTPVGMALSPAFWFRGDSGWLGLMTRRPGLAIKIRKQSSPSS